MKKIIMFNENVYDKEVNCYVASLDCNLHANRRMWGKKYREIYKEVAELLSKNPDVQVAYIDPVGIGDRLKEDLQEEFPGLEFSSPKEIQLLFELLMYKKKEKNASYNVDSIIEEENNGRESAS